MSDVHESAATVLSSGRQAAPWLQRLPGALFAMPVGLFGLAAAWKRALVYGWPLATEIGDTLLLLARAIWLILLALYAARCLFHRAAVREEYMHPVNGSLLALLPLSIMLAVSSANTPDSAYGLALVLFALLMQCMIAVRIVSMLATGQIGSAEITPALYLPFVGGGFVGGATMAALHYPGWGALLFGMGVAGWGLLEARVLSRLFEGPMPAPLRPIIGVELAPPAVATLAAAAIWPQLPGEVLIVGIGIAVGPILSVLVRYRWWHEVPFSVGFWSFSFPLAALAGAIVEVVRRSHWPPLVAALALGLASLLIVWLAFRTLGLLLAGRLLPAN